MFWLAGKWGSGTVCLERVAGKGSMHENLSQIVNDYGRVNECVDDGSGHL